MAKKTMDKKQEQRKKPDDAEAEILNGTVKEPPQTQPNMSDTSADLKELIEMNIKWTQVVYEQNRSIKNRLAWMVVGNYLRLFLLIAPIILGIIFLPPIIKDIWEQYQMLFGGASGTGMSPEGFAEILQLFQR